MNQVYIDHVPYDVSQTDPHRIKIENKWGMEGIRSLKRTNPWGEPNGTVDHMYYVEVGEETVEIQVSDKLIEACDNDVQEAFLDAIRSIEDHYDSVGWEFLGDPSK